jgi:coenzyme F420 biosynthesis associated uncharacterized protein
MVDWSLARQVARLAAGSGDEGPPQADVAALCAEMDGHVASYTGLSLGTPSPAPELVGRGEWASVNLDSLAKLLDPVAGRLEARLEFAGPLAGALKAGAAATVAAEAGLVIGYVAQRVLGQYEVSLLGGDAPPRLLFVAPNLRKAVRELNVDPVDFHRWICAHELTHVYQFQGVGWLRDHLGEMIRSYLSTVEVRIERGAAGGLPSMPDPAKLVETFRDGGLAALVQTKEQRAVMGRMQAAMAVVEGYSEHVMDAIGADLGPGYEQLREALEERRDQRGPVEAVLSRLLGMEIKLRQYRQGKAFCDEVAERRGIETLNKVWTEPAVLPRPSELEHPGRWLARVA